jgi:ATP-dependent RNA helicase SUPV3L1/SUV3
MRQAGFRAVEDPVEGAANWVFRGRPRARPPRPPRNENQQRRPRPEGQDRKPRRDGPPPKRQERGDGERRDRPDRGERRDRDDRRERKPVPAGAATAKALAGLADLLKRDD